MPNRNPVDVLVGSKVRYHRKQKNMTQTTLGQAIGVTFQQVQKYESGTNQASVGRLVQIAKALGVGPQDLLPFGSKEPVTELSPQALEMAQMFDELPSARLRKVHFEHLEWALSISKAQIEAGVAKEVEEA